MYIVNGVTKQGVWEDGKRLHWSEQVEKIKPLDWLAFKFTDEKDVLEVSRSFKIYK